MTNFLETHEESSTFVDGSLRTTSLIAERERAHFYSDKQRSQGTQHTASMSALPSQSEEYPPNTNVFAHSRDETSESKTEIDRQNALQRVLRPKQD